MESVAQASPKRQKQTTEVPQKEGPKLLEHTTAQPSPAKQTARFQRMKEEKGKDKVGDDVQTIPDCSWSLCCLQGNK
jgi:hypothetical protein